MDSGYLLQCSNCGTRNRVPEEKVGNKGKCGKCGSPLVGAHSLPIQVTDGTWSVEVLESRAPAMVEMWSPHCGICSQYEVSVRQMAANLYGKIRVLQLNVDENPETAQRYGIRGVPTVLLFRDGQLLSTLVGPQGEQGIRQAFGF
jgi:thioredoxin 2